MRNAPTLTGVVLVGILGLLPEAEDSLMIQLTPVLVVEAIEPCLPFWVDRLGFEITIEVPEGDRLGFVALERDGVEVMYQTRASLARDLPGVTSLPFGGPSHLYIQVADLDAVERALDGTDVIMPRRTTFYGATEIFVREPCGHYVGFAQPQSDSA
jgi:uncharacterized glyoxalase superfamily protein PhnB